MPEPKVATLPPPPELLNKEQIREQTEAALNPPETKPQKVSRRYTWHFEHYSRIYGKTLEGQFTNQILTPRLELDVGCLRSRLVATSITHALDANSGLTAERMAHLEISLVERPNWFNPLDFEDKELLDLIYMEVASHEARFWGREDHFRDQLERQITELQRQLSNIRSASEPD